MAGFGVGVVCGACALLNLCLNMIQYKYAETSDSGFEFDCGSNSAGYVELYHPCGHSSVKGFNYLKQSMC